MNRLGLIAGNRQYPLLFSRQAKLKDPSLYIVAVAVRGETDKTITKLVDKVYWVNIGRLNQLIDIFLRENIKKVVMAGQISPYRIFRDRSQWDDAMHKVADNCRDFRPHSIFTEVIKEIEKHNLTFISSLTYLDDYTALEGLNNNVRIDGHLRKQVDYSVSLARRIVDLDIGQTVVFKDKAIVAVEALEGTDNTIKRSYRICGEGFLVVKLAKKNQDVRFDVPVIGLKTIKLMHKCKAEVLVLQKDKTLILDKEKVISLADKARISIVGVE